jgi:hypothetical protein
MFAIGAAVPRLFGARRRALRGLRSIPLRTGGFGRFSLHARGDGRHVEVRDGPIVVAEAIAADDRDELVVDFDAVADADLDAYGAAVFGAIEIAAAADEERSAR